MRFLPLIGMGGFGNCMWQGVGTWRLEAAEGGAEVLIPAIAMLSHSLASKTLQSHHTENHAMYSAITYSNITALSYTLVLFLSQSHTQSMLTARFYANIA